MTYRSSNAILALSVALGCSSGGGVEPFEAPAPVSGPLAIRVIYPPTEAFGSPIRDGSVISAVSSYRVPRVDSMFVFGSVGRSDARLTINGQDIEIHPTGGWLAWIPVPGAPGDSTIRLRLNAVSGADLATSVLDVKRTSIFRPPSASGPWLDAASYSPTGDTWVRPGEGFRLSLRASPGARVRAILASGDTVHMLPARLRDPLDWGQQAFSVDPGVRDMPLPDRYVGWWTGALGPDPGPVLSPAPQVDHGNHSTIVEVILAGDTLRTRWPARVGVIESSVPPLAIVDDDTARAGDTDGLLPGRLTPHGTYQWFFPNGTVAAVSGRRNDQVRLRLSSASVAWVDAGDVRSLPQGTPPPVGVSKPPRLSSGPDFVTLRVPLPGRVPYFVDETEFEVRVRVYGVAPDIDWIQYGGTDPFVDLISFEQPVEDEVVFIVRLAEPVWGYRTRWEGDDLLLEIRRPPQVDSENPLSGRTLAIDAGHPPGGSTGPTGVREPDVTLAVARLVRTLAEEAGARVVMTRDSDAPVGLAERVEIAERQNAELLVSIHANALPDGVNPFVNNGTSVYYYHPRSAPLARELNRALVAQFGMRDLGMGRGDLALVRGTWMPSALTEGLFMMVPRQESILATPEGQMRYAVGVIEGIERFLRAVWR